MSPGLPGRWTLLRSSAESRHGFAVGKFGFLDASLFLHPGRGKCYIHGHRTAKHFMQEVLVAVLREDGLPGADRRVSRMNCGQCMEGVVLASNQDRGLSRVVADLICPRGKR